MKKLFYFAAFLIAASLTTVNAQSCAKKAGASSACCSKSKAATAKTVSTDTSIEKRVCAESGKVSFFRNSTCEISGKVTSQEVKLDKATGTFVNVSPERAAMPAAEGAKKACSSKASSSCQKSCSGKSAKSAMKAEAPAKATFTKGESN